MASTWKDERGEARGNLAGASTKFKIRTRRRVEGEYEVI
jgi:hypothetical protein